MMAFRILAILSALASATALTQLTDSNINDARDLWFSNQADCITTYGHVSDWDTSAVTNMRELFVGGVAPDFNEDLSAWDVSGATDMGAMFGGAVSFNSDISAWDMSSVTSIGGGFNFATSFNSDISAWDVSGAVNIGYAFKEAASFNSDISAWDVSGVTGMSSAFRSAASFNSDISTWDVGSVRWMDSTFRSATSFNSDLSAWDVSAVSDKGQAFKEAACFDCTYATWAVSCPAVKGDEECGPEYELYVGGKGLNCDSGYHLEDEAACETYANDEGVSYKGTVLSSRRPKGCYTKHSRAGAVQGVFFNTATSTKAKVWRRTRGVCKTGFTPTMTYAMASRGRNCAEGEVVETMDACQEAAAEMNLSFNSKSFYSRRRPAGCFRGQRSRVFFNTRLVAYQGGRYGRWGAGICLAN